jgi:hypothetical protein
VVTNHGGTVSAWSSEGAGSTFTIRMPDVAPGAIGKAAFTPDPARAVTAHAGLRERSS